MKWSKTLALVVHLGEGKETETLRLLQLFLGLLELGFQLFDPGAFRLVLEVRVRHLGRRGLRRLVERRLAFRLHGGHFARLGGSVGFYLFGMVDTVFLIVHDLSPDSE